MARTKTADAQENIPAYSSSSQFGYVLGSSLNSWDSSITNEKLEEMYLRTGFCYRIINKISDDVLDNGFSIENNDVLAKDIEELNKRVKLIPKFKKAYTYARLFGFSFLTLGWEDAAQKLSDDLLNAKDLKYAVPLMPSQISEIILDQDQRSERFGEVEFIVINSSGAQKKKIHWKRFLHIVHDDFKSNAKGVSSVLPAYNYLQTLENIIWAAGQAYYRNAAPFAKITINGASDKELLKYDEKMDDISVRTRFLSNENFGLEFLPTTPIDPTPFFQVALTAVCTTLGIPKQIAEGTNAGAISGSETNLKDYYSDLSSVQTLTIEPLLREIYQRCQDNAIIAQGDYDIKWESLFEMNEKDTALTEYAKSQAYLNYVNAGLVPKEEVEMPNILTDATTTTLSEEAVKRMDAARTRKLDTLEDKYFSTLKLIYNPSLTSSILSRVQEQPANFFERIKNKVRPDAVEPLTDVEYELMRDEIERVTKQNEQRFMQLLPALIGNVLESEGFSLENEGYQEAYNMIYENNFNYIKGFNDDLRKDLTGALATGIQSDWDLQKVREEFNKIITTMTDSRLKTIVRTETSRAINTLEFRSAKENNQKYKTWVTMGDERVRPSHEAMDGETVPIDQTFSIGVLYPPADPNCRCWVIYT